MPKPRKPSTSTGPLFVVSPWQNRGEKLHEKEQSAETDYAVVHEDLIAKPENAQSPAAGGQVQKPISAASPAAPSPQPPAALGWRTKSKHIEAVPTAEPDTFGGSITSELQDAQDLASPMDEGIPTTAPTESTTETLTGIAFFVILGGSRLVGNFILDYIDGSPSRTIPFHGREVTSYRECTRDMEWSVVKLHLLGLPGMAREVVVVAERTGGDAMRLKAPVEWQGAEAEVAAELGQGCDEGVEFEFECHSLLADAAADKELEKVMPDAVGMGAMVNIGPMIVRRKKVWSGGGDSGF